MSRQTKSKNADTLKQAFRHEVHPQEYLFRVWVTSIIAAGLFAYLVASKGGHFDLSLVLPMGASWSGHDPSGGLYMETWGNILVNSLQVGFGFWGSVLIFLGVFRACTAHKFVFACFYLGIAFIGFTLMMPSWTQILLNMLIEKCPALVR